MKNSTKMKKTVKGHRSKSLLVLLAVSAAVLFALSSAVVILSNNKSDSMRAPVDDRRPSEAQEVDVNAPPDLPAERRVVDGADSSLEALEIDSDPGALGVDRELEALNKEEGSQVLEEVDLEPPSENPGESEEANTTNINSEEV